MSMDQSLKQKLGCCRRAGAVLPSWLFGFMQTLIVGLARGRQREHLARLDDDALRNIGLTREDVRRETAKFFWER